jgi:hypothetical protein
MRGGACGGGGAGERGRGGGGEAAEGAAEAILEGELGEGDLV